jgi:hypothetical protein
MRSALAKVALVALVLTAGGPTGTAAATDFESEGNTEFGAPKITDLRVVGAEGDWQAESTFQLSWDQVPAEPAFPIAAVEYQLYAASGAAIGGVVRNTAELYSIDRLQVPAPGAYTVEVWLRDTLGRAGPPTTAALRYDDTAPAAPLPQTPAGWIAADAAVLSIGHPPGEQPISGIRGYAISIDGDAGSSPCASASRCTVAETDLKGGIDDDSLSLGQLPEGTTVARVVAVSGAGVASPIATATFQVDATRPVVRLTGAPDAWADGPVRVRATASDSLSGMASAGPAGPFTAIAVDGGAPTVVPGDTAAAVVTGSGVHGIAFFARDAAGNVADGSAEAPGPETATVRIDEVPPTVRFAESQDPVEPERIEATVEDVLSGPSNGRGSIGLRQVGSKGAFQELPTRIVAGKLVTNWDSDSFPPGKYEFRAAGYDAAGNVATGASRARGGRMILVNPLKARVLLESGLGGKKPASRTIPYGRGVRFGGRLRTLSGRPLAGLEVTIAETFKKGARAERRTTYARTSQDGTFSTWLGPGPGREIVASYGGNRVLTRASGRSIELGVLGSVLLHASSPVARIGGRAIVFSGRIGRRDAKLPRQGRPVELQFRCPGTPWGEFRTVQTDARGRYRYRYAFSDDDSRGVRFQFRAYAPTEDGWPYEAAYSRPVSVTGR